ncbi:unnamed protein product [Nesidiocoris tenuis]|uniref:Uncharacterized protein n=1 Tax=Nesidiocoris tenuis TaxID=355587 RepID=A0A6H5FWD0_9HEMI|nr:unnamed protein product [Nesidiocoris tenuis]
MEELFAIKMLDQGHSYKAVTPSGKVVGVVINVHFPDIPDDDEPNVPGRIQQRFIPLASPETTFQRRCINCCSASWAPAFGKRRKSQRIFETARNI